MPGMMIALLSGVLMSVQGVFNTEVTRQTSLWVSSAFVQFTALLACLAAWFFTDRSSFLSIGDVEPITITVIKSMEALGPARAAMLIVLAQLVAAYLIELMGWFGVEKQPFLWRRMIGLGIMVAGVVIFKW